MSCVSGTRRLVRLVLLLLVVSPCLIASLSLPASAQDEEPMLIEDIGSFHRAITTSSPEAQRYFDQALTLYYGFNHEEAIRSFRGAIADDPDCAMAYWGIALSAGPHYNNPSMDEAASELAHEMSTKALDLAKAGKTTPLETELIEALMNRYAWPVPEDRKPLDQAWADAMREVWRRHQDDADVGALYAESMMDLRPWDLWTDDGKMQPGTKEIIKTLEEVLKFDEMHIGANHFYIHSIEPSAHPERAAASAERLRNRTPGAGHLVHMPAHIDIRLGRYHEAIIANQLGIAADERYAAKRGRYGFYTVYRAHNYHFLAYAAMFDGQKQLALDAARSLGEELPLDFVREIPEFLDAFVGVPVHVMVRFGMWNELLEEPAPPDDLPLTKAYWHYGRTLAYSALGRVEEGAAELAAFQAAAAAVPESYLVGNNTGQQVLQIGLPMAEGELEYRRGNTKKAFDLLRQAVKHDDALRYDEPWGWMQPARHALGALLVEQGEYKEAEQVYRKDLERHPGNGWALNGLAECLRERGRTREAEETEAAFRQAWARSDIVIHASCFCRTKS